MAGFSARKSRQFNEKRATPWRPLRHTDVYLAHAGSQKAFAFLSQSSHGRVEEYDKDIHRQQGQRVEATFGKIRNITGDPAMDQPDIS